MYHIHLNNNMNFLKYILNNSLFTIKFLIMSEVNSSIRKEVSKSEISVSRVYKSEYQKDDTMTAELKQTVTTNSFYPTKSVANSLQDNIFTMSDFGFEEQSYENKEVRVAWIDVPTGMSKENVQAKLASTEGSTLYRVLSNKPIISDTEQYAIDNEDLDVSLDDFANRQAVRFPKGHESEGELALDANGKIQYRRIAFSKANAEDTDIRTEEASDFYASPELEAELNSEVQNIESQSI